MSEAGDPPESVHEDEGDEEVVLTMGGNRGELREAKPTIHNVDISPAWLKWPISKFKGEGDHLSSFL